MSLFANLFKYNSIITFSYHCTPSSIHPFRRSSTENWIKVQSSGFPGQASDQIVYTCCLCSRVYGTDASLMWFIFLSSFFKHFPLLPFLIVFPWVRSCCPLASKLNSLSDKVSKRVNTWWDVSTIQHKMQVVPMGSDTLKIGVDTAENELSEILKCGCRPTT